MVRIDKCSWYTSGGDDTRKQFPKGAKVLSVAAEDGSKSYGMVMDGIAIGDPEFIQAHCRGIVDQMALDMQALNALLLPGRMGKTG